MSDTSSVYPQFQHHGAAHGVTGSCHCYLTTPGKPAKATFKQSLYALACERGCDMQVDILSLNIPGS